MGIYRVLKGIFYCALLCAFCFFALPKGYAYLFHTKAGKEALERQGKTPQKVASGFKSAMEYTGMAPKNQNQTPTKLLASISSVFELVYSWCLSHKFLLLLASLAGIYLLHANNIVQFKLF